MNSSNQIESLGNIIVIRTMRNTKNMNLLNMKYLEDVLCEIIYSEYSL